MQNIYPSVLTATANLNDSQYAGYNYFIIDCTSGNITLTINDIGYNGLYYYFVRRDTSGNTLDLATTNYTINGNSTESIGTKIMCCCTFFDNNWTLCRIAYT